MTTQRLNLRLAGLIACLAGFAFHTHAQTLYYGATSTIQANNTLHTIATNGTANTVILTASGSVQRCTAVAVDSLNSQLFLADNIASEIWSYNLSGGAQATVGSVPGYVSGLALDPVKQLIYYSISSAALGSNTVRRMTYTGSSNTVVFAASGIDGNGVIACTALAVDTLNSLIFIADSPGRAIWEINLAGGNLTTLKNGLPGQPLDLAVDSENQLVYFTTSGTTPAANTVQRVSYTGSNTVLFAGTSATNVQRCTSLDLDLPNAKIYFSDAGNDDLWSMPQSGTSSPALVKSGLSPGTVKKVRLLAPSVLGTNQHFSYATLVENTPNLIAYWPFSPATQANSFDNGYTGQFVGAAAIGGAGSGPPLFSTPSNTALVLNGSNSDVTTSLVGGLDTTGATADQGTIIGWFNLAALPSTLGHFFTIAAESYNGNDFDVQIETDNKLKFYTDAGSSTIDPTPFTAGNLNTWYFFAATFNTNLSRSIYLNGSLVANSVPGGSHNPALGGQFSIGASTVWPGRYFDGSIDEVAVFNRALSAAEISTLYSAGQGIAFIPLNIQRSGSNVIVSWTDPTSLFFLQSAPALNGIFSNVPGAASPYTRTASGGPLFFKLKSQ
jgi:hypothetical protein